MTFREASRVTLEEYAIYNTAYAIQQEESRYQAAVQAWFNQGAKATKGRGKSTKSAYKNFEEFYNHKAEFDKIFEPEKPVNRTLSMAEKNRLINKQRKEGD